MAQSSAHGECVLRLAPFLLAERTVRDKRRDAQLPQVRGQLFRLGAAVDEDEPLLSSMEPRDHHGRVFQGPHVIQHDLSLARRGRLRLKHLREPRHEPAIQSSNTSGLPTVADKPMR